RAEAWVNTGALLSRMSFGLQLASGRVNGVDLDLPGLNRGREPESRDEALQVYARLLLPGRNLDPVLKQLGPMVNDPNLSRKVDEATPGEPAATMEGGMTGDETILFGDEDMEPQGRRDRGRRGDSRPSRDQHPPTAVEQVVGVILGSPEFQRR
ncbi:MAG TPA: DUF1800 domain-containing protein, partial [Thermoanaerobaculia bacterium]